MGTKTLQEKNTRGNRKRHAHKRSLQVLNPKC